MTDPNSTTLAWIDSPAHLAQVEHPLVFDCSTPIRRILDNALRQTMGLYQGLFESNTLGIALLDVNGMVQAHNCRLSDLLNLQIDPPEVFPLAGWVSERERPRFHDLLRTYQRRNPTPATHEFTFQIDGRGPRLFRLNTGWISETSQICIPFLRTAGAASPAV
jgi:PAS domain-containing protein